MSQDQQQHQSDLESGKGTPAFQNADMTNTIGNSVTNDLMQIYESMTQSSTPQTEAAQSDRPQQQQQHAHATMPQLQLQQQQQQTPMPSHQPQHHIQYAAPPHGQQQQPSAESEGMSYPAALPVPSYPPASGQMVPQQFPPGQPQVAQQTYYPPAQEGAAVYMPTIQEHQQPQQTGQHQQQPPPPSQIIYEQPHQQTQHLPASDSSAKVDDNGDDSQQEENQSVGGRARPRRKKRSPSFENQVNQSDAGSIKSGRGGVRKKGKTTDGRWSKRFSWPEDLHRDFVSAIFDVGLKHSSPSTILEQMPKHEQITTERIKSHLQKYRLHRAKSKKEFMASYETAMKKLQSGVLPSATSVSHGEVAANLSYSAITDSSASMTTTVTAATPQLPTSNRNQPTPTAPVPTNQPQVSLAGSEVIDTKTGADRLMLPKLTEAEKASPMGAAMGYLMGLFFSLKQQLMIQRAAEAAGEKALEANAPVQAVFNSFVASPGDAAVGVDQQGHNYAQHPQAQAQQGQLPPHQLHQQPPQGYEVVTPAHASKAVPATVLSAPSLRSNLEESNMMKRDMQNQMAFQNKMRALKQQELDKYKAVPMQEFDSKQPASTEDGRKSSEPAVTFGKAEDSNQFQGTGESAAADERLPNERQRSLSIEGPDDFWNTDMVDEQLFEFLMNN